MPTDAKDERLQKRLIQVLKPTVSCYKEEEEEEEGNDIIAKPLRVLALPAATQRENREDARREHDIEDLWNHAVEINQLYQGARQAVATQQRKFPVALQLKCSIAKCKVEDEVLYYQDRK